MDVFNVIDVLIMQIVTYHIAFYSASVEVAGSLALWEPTQGKRRVGGQHYTYVDQLKRDTGLKDVKEIRSLMLERDDWRSQKGARVRLRRPV